MTSDTESLIGEPEAKPKSGIPSVPLLRTSLVLPLFDSIFAVALTLLAYSIPDSVMSVMDAGVLISSISIYLLSGLTVLIYWFKLRRLLQLARQLHPAQAVIALASLLVIVLLPKLGALVVAHGSGTGDFRNWTPAQIVNTAFLGALLLFDLLCLMLALSLLRKPSIHARRRTHLRSAIRVQFLGFLCLLALGILQLALASFNTQYIFLVPVILVAEEWLTTLEFQSI